MKQSQISPEFLQSLGQAVLDFGFMESAIRSALITLSREQKLARVLVPAGNAVSENLELLTRLCHLKIHPTVLDDWLNAIADIKNLFVERNQIFHGMFFEDDDTLFIGKVKKGKKGAEDLWLQLAVDPTSVKTILERLANRRRQLMDFLDDFSQSEEGSPHLPSQDAFPYLTINAKT